MTTTLLTPDAYMDLLLERQAAYESEHPPVGWVRPLIEWFIQPGDEDLIDMAAIDAENARTSEQPKRVAKPRTYRSAASLIEERDRLAAKRDALSDMRRHGTDDLAAYGGVGVRQTSRQRAKYGARMERALSEYVRIDGKVKALDSRIVRAQAREAGRYA